MIGKGTFIAFKQEDADKYAKVWTGTHNQFAYPLEGNKPSTNVNMRRKEFISNKRFNSENFLQESVRSVTGGYSFNYSPSLFPLLALSLNLDETEVPPITILDDESTIKSINILEVYTSNKMINFKGMCVSNATISVPSLESSVKFNVDFMGVDETPQTFSGNLPNHHLAPQLTNLPFNTLYPSYLSKLDNGLGSPAIPFLDFSLNIKNNVLKGEFLSTSGKNYIKPKVGMREITGNYTKKFDTIEDMNFFKATIKNNVNEKLRIWLRTIEGNDLKILMSEVQYDTGTLTTLNLGDLTLNVSFIATGTPDLEFPI